MRERITDLIIQREHRTAECRLKQESSQLSPAASVFLTRGVKACVEHIRKKKSDIFLLNIKDTIRMCVLLRLRWKTYKSHAESASADDRVSIYAIVLQIIEL